MAHIQVPYGLPGIVGLMAQYPQTAIHLNGLAEELLRGPSTLTSGERETIASFVSSRNECCFCENSHSAAARYHLGEQAAVVDAVKHDIPSAQISDKMKALLQIAARVQESGRNVSADDIARARAEGATDDEIHHTVLIAAAFCMFNRYVDGLGTWAPPVESGAYEPMGEMLATRGYLNSVPPAR